MERKAWSVERGLPAEVTPQANEGGSGERGKSVERRAWSGGLGSAWSVERQEESVKREDRHKGQT